MEINSNLPLSNKEEIILKQFDVIERAITVFNNKIKPITHISEQKILNDCLAKAIKQVYANVSNLNSLYDERNQND